jgi:hypothetical protein
MSCLTATDQTVLQIVQTGEAFGSVYQDLSQGLVKHVIFGNYKLSPFRAELLT